MIKWLKSRGFTDRLYFLNLTLSWLFVITCVILTVAVEPNMDVVAYGIPAVFTELAIHTGFIIWKAKHENISKHRLDLPEGEIDWYDDIDGGEDDE